MTPPVRPIQVLPDSVANQIAAGEVVERPASVVKELVENALDAGAAHIRVEVERGGRQRVRVIDDGVGMGRQDAIMCLERHATSKITKARELRGVASFGFRGEALPSIAAVSRLTLDTCDESGAGTRIRATGGTITSVDEHARARGTTIEAANLFFNAPARRSFLKSGSTETRVVAAELTSLALAHPEVAFTLTSDGRALIDLPADPGPARRIGRLWGADAHASMFAFAGEGRIGRVSGLLQRPDQARPGPRRTYLFVAGRPFRDNGLREAVRRGYRTTVRESARPWFFLYLDLPGGQVDVNVHPAKLEVRFRDRAGVEGFIEEEIRRALAGEESAATLDSVTSGIESAASSTGDRAPGSFREPSNGESAPADRVRESAEYAPGPAGRSSDSSSDPGRAQIALFASGAPAAADAAVPVTPAEEVPVEPSRLWQLHQTYILAEVRGGMMMIDQHSAHERILFQELMEAFGKGGQPGQRLLFPITMTMSPAEYRHVEPLFGMLGRAGFEVDGFGGDAIIVHAVPNPHPYFDAERCLREMIGELTHGSELVRAARNQHERIAMTFACKGAIKAGRQLSQEEMRELIDRLFATDLPHHDVHGRPTAVRLSLSELERRFGRT
jgi:DNA mismatch repair protein MutL